MDNIYFKTTGTSDYITNTVATSARFRRRLIFIGTHLPILLDSFGILGVSGRARECARECGGHTGASYCGRSGKCGDAKAARKSHGCAAVCTRRKHTWVTAQLFCRCNQNLTVQPNLLYSTLVYKNDVNNQILYWMYTLKFIKKSLKSCFVTCVKIISVWC